MEDEPALGFYKMGAWQSREYTAEEEDGHAPLERDLVLEFRPDDVGEVRVKLPMAFINSEARAVALSRASQHGIETRFCQDTQSHVFMRAFRPTQVESEIHSLNRVPVIYEGGMTRLAIPEAVFWDDAFALLDFLNDYFSIDTLFLVVDPLPDGYLEQGHSEMRCRWEMKRVKKVSGLWDPRDGGSFFSYQDSDEFWQVWIDRVNKSLKDGKLPVTHHRRLDIFSVFAVRG